MARETFGVPQAARQQSWQSYDPPLLYYPIPSYRQLSSLIRVSSLELLDSRLLTVYGKGSMTWQHEPLNVNRAQIELL